MNKQTNEKILLLDMDGVLAMLYAVTNFLKAMWDKGVFRDLKPYKRMLAAIKKFIKMHPDVKVYILSACISEQCMKEKHEWLNEHLPEIPAENRILIMTGESKAEAAKKLVGELNQEVFLLDDHTPNLNGWVAAGGSGIKARNEINCNNNNKSKSWKGNKVSCFGRVDEIVEDLEDIIFG